MYKIIYQEAKGMVEKLLEFLRSRGYEYDWNEYLIEHTPPKSERIINQIKNFYGERKGIYIYIDEKNNCLYIGIGKLKDRVRFHYLEALGLYSGKGCEKHIKFFTQFQGTMKVLWTVENDRNQQIHVEKTLTEEFEPLYEGMKKKGFLY
jgi:excinuclease UvrABC nuclease subunit